MTEHLSIDAVITDRWGGVETVYAGSIEAWAWEDKEAAGPWKRAKRQMLLADRAYDTRGWSVRFRVTP